MTKQEYMFIRNLSWMLLIDSKTSRLPVDIEPIAKLYESETLIAANKTRYDNAIAVSRSVLNAFGINPALSKYLAIRILAPLAVLREINISSADALAAICDIPLDVAGQRFERYQTALSKGRFGTSTLESTVLSQFKAWLKTID